MAMLGEVCCGEDRSVGAGLGKGFINHTGLGSVDIGWGWWGSARRGKAWQEFHKLHRVRWGE